MAKTDKELAFLRDLYVQNEWTVRFTDLVDKHMDLTESENMLYINAGSGGHALVIHEKFGETTNIFAVCESSDLVTIATDKAAAVSADVDFSSLRFEDDAFDAVLADTTFVKPTDLEPFIEDALRVSRTGGDIAIFLPGAGSFGEIFSVLWEVFLDQEFSDLEFSPELLVSDLPTASYLEELSKKLGVVNINVQQATEIFEYENAAEFVSSPIIEDFLMPLWLNNLDETDRERVSTKLAELIEAEDGDAPFLFTVKATLLTGEKS